MSSHRKVLRVGRMGARHRRASHVLLAACAFTGLGWFLLMDVAGWAPPRLVAWWILHGLSGLVALGVIGAALPQHVPVAWSHARNRWLGGATLGLVALVAGSAAALLYGKDDWHAAVHWAHVIGGCTGLIVFVAHVLVGRRAVGRLPPRSAPRRHAR